MAVQSIPISLVRFVFWYSAETGLLRWRLKANRNALIGGVAGAPNARGYLTVRFSGSDTQLVHRVVWAHAHGEWPDRDVDHINGDRSDNRLANLRLATRSENNQNMRNAKSYNSTGFLGVSRSNARFIASISVSGKTTHLGAFATAEEAHSAYLRAKRVLHPFGNLPSSSD
jgi:hypothetical protein